MTKPIGPEEMQRIIARIGWRPDVIASVVGADLDSEVDDTDKARIIRALAMSQGTKAMVAKFRPAFPDLQVTAVWSD